MARPYVLGLLTLLSCVTADGPTAREPESGARFDARVASLWEDAFDHVVWPKCTDEPQRGECGLIAPRFMQPSKVAEFQVEFCGEVRDAPMGEECTDRLEAAFRVALARRYPGAKQAEVFRLCEQTAGACDSYVGHELQWLRGMVLCRDGAVGQEESCSCP